MEVDSLMPKAPKSVAPKPPSSSKKKSKSDIMESLRGGGVFSSLCFIAALIVSAVYSAKLSHVLKVAADSGRWNTADLGELAKRCNDIQVCAWLFVWTPVLNVGLAAGLAVNVEKLEKDLGVVSDNN